MTFCEDPHAIFFNVYEGTRGYVSVFACKGANRNVTRARLLWSSCSNTLREHYGLFPLEGAPSFGGSGRNSKQYGTSVSPTRHIL